MRILIIVICLVIASNNHAQVPKAPTEAEVRQVFNQNFGQNLLFFNPYQVPIEIERTHKSMAKKLDQWVALGLYTKTKTRFMAEKMMYGEPREVSVGGFKYELNQTNPWVSEQGAFYGRPNMQELFDVSTPTHVGSDYYSEVYLSWYVVDMPEWIKKVDLRERKHRQLKRAIESEKKPFEKRLYLLFREGRWQIWDEKGKQSLF